MPDFVLANPTSNAVDPYTQVDRIFDSAYAIAAAKSAASDALFQSAQGAGGGVPVVTPATLGFNPNVIEPDVNIPSQAEGASVAKFYEMSTAVINQLADLFEGYINQYFPNECGYLQHAQEWLCKALTEGGTGIAAHIETQIWERDRARILKDAQRAEDTVLSTWASKGYPLPPGAALHQVSLVRQEAQEKIAQASRDVAIKQAELEVQNVRFAVENAIKLYGSAMSAASDYIKALAVGPQAGMQLIPSITDSQSKLIGAASEYYRARISVEELKLKAAMPEPQWAQEARLKNADYRMENVKILSAAAVEAAKSMGTQAAAALNALHASAGISGSESRGVNFSYSNDTISAAPTII